MGKNKNKETYAMKFISKLYPIMPTKGDTTQLIVGLLLYILGPVILTPVITILFAITVILAVLIPVVLPLMYVYALAGVVFTILNFLGVINFASFKEKKED